MKYRMKGSIARRIVLQFLEADAKLVNHSDSSSIVRRLCCTCVKIDHLIDRFDIDINALVVLDTGRTPGWLLDSIDAKLAIRDWYCGKPLKGSRGAG